ncbi:hypothetical protein BGZ88_005226 [Linnemannia elongata]|nr:hypothetical protein BGZ88_005226 [Linnemannia elongata]
MQDFTDDDNIFTNIRIRIIVDELTNSAGSDPAFFPAASAFPVIICDKTVINGYPPAHVRVFVLYQTWQENESVRGVLIRLKRLQDRGLLEGTVITAYGTVVRVHYVDFSGDDVDLYRMMPVHSLSFQ